MRRILFSLVVWAALAGGLWLYMKQRDARPVESPRGRAAVAATDEFALELTPTFTPVPDPFALAGDGENAGALSARLRGRDLVGLEAAGAAGAGAPVRVDKLPGVVRGMNEIAVAASPPNEDVSRRNFLQARVFRNGVPVAERTFWADAGARVEGVVGFDAPGEAGNDE